MKNTAKLKNQFKHFWKLWKNIPFFFKCEILNTSIYVTIYMDILERRFRLMCKSETARRWNTQYVRIKRQIKFADAMI